MDCSDKHASFYDTATNTAVNRFIVQAPETRKLFSNTNWCNLQESVSKFSLKIYLTGLGLGACTKKTFMALILVVL
jgi:hypothetical protein